MSSRPFLLTMYERRTASRVKPHRSATRWEAGFPVAATRSIRCEPEVDESPVGDQPHGAGHVALRRARLARASSPTSPRAFFQEKRISEIDPSRWSRSSATHDRERRRGAGVERVVALEQVVASVGRAVGERHPRPARDLGVLACGHERLRGPNRATRAARSGRRPAARPGARSGGHALAAADAPHTRPALTVAAPRGPPRPARARARRAPDPASRAIARPGGVPRARGALARRARRRSSRAHGAGGRAVGGPRGRCVCGGLPALAPAARCPVGGGTDETGHTSVPVAPSASSAAWRSDIARVAAAPRSVLVRTSTSGTSMMPALRNWSTSPDAGCSTTATVSAASATSVSDWPTPTVSITTTSNAAASASEAARVAGARPPRRVPAAVERMNTWRSLGSASIRARSPSSEPPDRRELGSTASTATDRSLRAPVLDELREQRGLADPGGPGDADDVAPAPRGRARRGRPRRAAPAACSRASGRAALDQVERRGSSGEVTVAQAPAELAAVCQGARAAQAPTAVSTPWRSATSPMMSRIIPFRFQSLGV